MQTRHDTDSLGFGVCFNRNIRYLPGFGMLPWIIIDYKGDGRLSHPKAKLRLLCIGIGCGASCP
jgi:hypothetical protein